MNRSVLITGASRGIGKALALTFAREGAAVALAARRIELLQEVARQVEALGGRALPVVCDVTKEADTQAAVAATVGAFGRLDVAIANAGFGVSGRVEMLSIDDFRRQFETNIYGALYTVKAALPELEKTRGRLALVGSVSGWIAMPGTAPYSMSKFAVRALADALYYEMLPKGVSVTLVSPGFVESEIRRTDNQGRHHPGAPDPAPGWLIMPAEKAAQQMARAIAQRRREVIVTRHGKLAVWIYRHFPWVVRFAVERGRRNFGSQ